MSLEDDFEKLSLNQLIKQKLIDENVDKSVFQLIEELHKLNVFTLFIDTAQRTRQGSSINTTALDILNLNCDKYLMYSCLKRFLSGKYILLLFQENTIGILANRCNIKDCQMINNASNLDNGFAKPTMVLDKTPVVDLSIYTLQFSYEKIINTFDNLLKRSYYLFKKDEESIEFYKAVGFDYEKKLEDNINY